MFDHFSENPNLIILAQFFFCVLNLLYLFSLFATFSQSYKLTRVNLKLFWLLFKLFLTYVAFGFLFQTQNELTMLKAAHFQCIP